MSCVRYVGPDVIDRSLNPDAVDFDEGNREERERERERERDLPPSELAVRAMFVEFIYLRPLTPPTLCFSSPAGLGRSWFERM